MTETNLFSIDVEAHLRKAASHTFGTAEHYPVELVRAALRRGAVLVDVQLTRDRLVIQDNGSGLDAASIDALSTIMDTGQPDHLKEEAVESIQTQEGLGLLAIFAANPTDILVETVSAAGKFALHFKKNRFEKSGAVQALPVGSRITLLSTHRDIEREKYVLEAFCRSVSREVKLNGRSIGRHPLLIGQFATVPLTPSSFARVGQVGVPQGGRNCHFRLLDQGIPWHHFALPPQQGFIFDAAIETTNELSKEFIGHLCQHARQLYQWLSERYAAADPVHQERIEELLFTYCRLTGDDSLILDFAPFRVLNAAKALSLRQVKEKAGRGMLYAVPQHRESLRYNKGGKTVLSITREQADLLINHLNLSLNFLSPVTRQPGLLLRWRLALRRVWRRFLSNLTSSPKKALAEHQLGKPEQMFIFALTRYLARPGEYAAVHLPGVHPLFVAAKGPFPAVFAKKNKKQLLIRRDHPLVRKAVEAVQKDPKNIEMFVPLIASGD